MDSRKYLSANIIKIDSKKKKPHKKFSQEQIQKHQDSIKSQPLKTIGSEQSGVNSDSESEISEVKVDDNLVIVKKAQHRRCMLKARGQRRIRWDLFVMFLAIINLFYVPFNVAFESDIGDSKLTDLMNWFIDLFFIIDIFVNFRTTIVNSVTGEENNDPYKIALKYVKGKFWVDLLASVPFDMLVLIFIKNSSEDGSTLQMFGLLKLVRILRLSRLISYMNLKDDLKMSLKLGKLVFFLMMYLHCVGCIWYFIAKQDEKWIPPLDYVYITTDIYSESTLKKYWNAMYHAVLLLGGNDIGPRGTFQLVFITSLLFASAIINANIFGNIAVLLQQLNKKSANFQEKVENAHSAMKNLQIPEYIQDQVQKYLDYTQSTSDHQQELDRFLKLISPSLRELVVKHISNQAVKKNPVLKNHPDILNSVLSDLTTLLFTPEDTIIRQMEKPDFIYFVCRGE